ncbi:MAG: hypothetical protein FWE47_01985, partial [Oscillospiraceae bacterium]|nr:hypothetical protein [Oscillospiraceae bacterium]
MSREFWVAIVGAFSLLVLSLFGWAKITIVSFNVFNLFGKISDTSRLLGTFGIQAPELTSIKTISAIMLALLLLSFALLITSFVKKLPKLQIKFAYWGFGLNILVSFLFIVSVLIVNQVLKNESYGLVSPIIGLTPIPFLMLAVAIAAVVLLDKYAEKTISSKQQKAGKEIPHFFMYLIITLSVLLVDILLWKFAPDSWNFGRRYNSYPLQAKAWLWGQLDLPEDYGWLEIATFKGKHYISFPPIPSVILLPFIAIFGGAKTLPFHNFSHFVSNIANYVTFIMVTLSAIFAYKIAIKKGVSQINAYLLTFILTIASGFMFIMCNGAVWFIAQSFSFSFLIMAIYFSITASHKHTKWALLLYALSVGCRPLNALWIILIAVLLWKFKKVASEEVVGEDIILPKKSFFKTLFAKIKIWDFVPAACVALFLMILNYARFGNIIEFGHNYLPEFDITHEKFAGAQFGLEHLWGNLKTLFKMPNLRNGQLHFDRFNGIFFIIPCAIYLVFAIAAIFGNRKEWKNWAVITVVGVTILHIIITCMHRTMGGWHWGHRYLIDMT